MKSKRVIVLGVSIILIIILGHLFSGIFGHFSDERNEVIGFVTEDGVWLDLEGNIVDRDDDESDEDALERAIREEEEAMRNQPRLNISASEVYSIFNSFSFSNDFDVTIDFQNGQEVRTITITIPSVDPLSDLELMREFEQLTAPILMSLGLDYYPEEIIENMMMVVLETDARIDFNNYTETMFLQFATHREATVSLFEIGARN